MPRIKRLENEELGYLRDRIRQVYQNRHPTENLPILNAYLPNYEELKSDILRQVPDALGSVSENRLRKLYYYTDSEHHSENGLQSPNFGIDFLDACYRYISENNFDREGYRNRSVVNTTEKKPAVIWFRVALIGVILAGCGWWLWPKPGQVDLGHLPIKEGFDDNSMPALQERGWNLMDPDTRDLQNRTGQDIISFSLYRVLSGRNLKNISLFPIPWFGRSRKRRPGSGPVLMPLYLSKTGSPSGWYCSMPIWIARTLFI